MKIFKPTSALLFLLFAVTVTLSSGDNSERISKKIPMTGEKSLVVRMEYGNGEISVHPLDNEKLLEADFVCQKGRPDFRYDKLKNKGVLKINFANSGEDDNSDQSHSITSLDNLYENQLNLRLSRKIPIDLNMNLGLIKGDINLGGLKITEANFEIGVSKGEISFNEINPKIMRRFSIEGGVGKLKVNNIGNANFENFHFNGGVGSYLLDFTGTYQQDSKATINIGMGKVKILLPRKIGTRLRIEKSFFSSCEIDQIYKDGDYYYNDNWQKTEHNLDVMIDADIGKVEVVWIEE